MNNVQKILISDHIATALYLRRCGSMKIKRSTKRRCMSDQPLFCFTSSRLGMKAR